MPGGVAFGAQVGSHRIESLIGSGPAGIVYRATHVRLGTSAAVKVMAPQWCSDPAYGERFLHDVNIAAETDHRHIVPIHDAGEQDGALFVVMRHVTGGDLKTLLARGGALSAQQATALLRPVADALDAAHARGLVHGDVKPSNVLLEWSPDGEVDHVYLCDFGMPSYRPPDNGAARGASLGDRFDCMAPEQIAGATASAQADVYSLGCVIYQALTGRAAFGRGVGGAVLDAHLHGGVEPPSSARAGVPHAVDQPILAAMAKEPRERLETCGALLDELGAAAEDRLATETSAEPQPAPARVSPPPPPSPPPAPVPARPARRARRPRAGAALLAVFLLVAAAGGYAASRLVRGDGGDSARATAGEALRPASDKAVLGALAAAGVPDVRCTVTRAPAGAVVLENASCQPRQPGEAPVRRLTLTRFRDREGLDRIYRSARALDPDPAARRRGDCVPDGPWGGYGRWFADAAQTRPGGRMFCTTARRQSRIVWSVFASTVLAEATASDSAALGAWWVRHRDLRRPAGAG